MKPSNSFLSVWEHIKNCPDLSWEVFWRLHRPTSAESSQKLTLAHGRGNSFPFQPPSRSDPFYSSSSNIALSCPWDFTCNNGKHHQIISSEDVCWIIRCTASTGLRGNSHDAEHREYVYHKIPINKRYLNLKVSAHIPILNGNSNQFQNLVLVSDSFSPYCCGILLFSAKALEN